MPMGQVNFPFVDQQAVEQLEYLDKISVRWNWKLLATLLLFTFFLVTGALICRQRSLQNWSSVWKIGRAHV